jgi:hypothetical protein
MMVGWSELVSIEVGGEVRQLSIVLCRLIPGSQKMKLMGLGVDWVGQIGI